MPKRYNTPHRSHVVKTRLTDEEYADFTERLRKKKMTAWQKHCHATLLTAVRQTRRYL